MTTQTMKGPGVPLGVFSDYSNHVVEFPIKIREKEQNNLEILASDDQVYMTIIARDNRKILYDDQGSAILNIRNKALNFGGEYQVFEGDTDKFPLFTVKNKWSMGGPKMVANFINFDDNPVEIQIRGKFLNGHGKITLNDEPVARFEEATPEPRADKPNKMEVVSKMTVAPLVDVAMAVALLACMQDISSF